MALRSLHSLVAVAITSLLVLLNNSVARSDEALRPELQQRVHHTPLRALRAEKAPPLQRAVQRYLDNDELEAHLSDFTKRCSSIARLTSIGKSVEGRELLALEISDRPGQDEPEPNVKLVGNLHGDEPTGRVLTLALAEWLCANYRKDATATRIVNDVHLWLLPTANPDGFAVRKRHNRGDQDLNRNFPDRFDGNGMAAKGREEPEVRALMQWGTSRRFTASLAFHEGALVANYPWDGTPNKTTEYDACPDDATFRHLATSYARAHRTMALPTNKEFPAGGTTNGAAWYPIYGSMQDWNYVVARCMELTLEVSETKWPPEEGLANLFEDNRQAMLQFVLQGALGGVRGSVMAESTSLRKDKGQELRPVEANITVEGIDFAVRSGWKHGDYYRPLAPGRYTLLVRGEGLVPSRSNVTVPADGSGVVHNFVLRQRRPPSMDTAAGVAGALAALDKVEHRGDNMLLVVGGMLLMLGLWQIHKRMVHRSGVLGRQRSM